MELFQGSTKLHGAANADSFSDSVKKSSSAFVFDIIRISRYADGMVWLILKSEDVTPFELKLIMLSTLSLAMMIRPI